MFHLFHSILPFHHWNKPLSLCCPHLGFAAFTEDRALFPRCEQSPSRDCLCPTACSKSRPLRAVKPSGCRSPPLLRVTEHQDHPEFPSVWILLSAFLNLLPVKKLFASVSWCLGQKVCHIMPLVIVASLQVFLTWQVVFRHME